MGVYFDLHNNVKSKCIYGTGAKENIDLTIVIPTFKRRNLLVKTLLSIINQKKPTSIRFQVLIVSNEEDFEVSCLNMELDPEVFSVYCNESNLGMVGNMNRCARLATGLYVAYIQDDDVLLDNYIIEFENLYKKGVFETIDCIIPNRYYYYDKNNTESTFGKKAFKAERKKLVLKKILSIGCKKRMFQRINSLDCAETWYNCYSGGPTCGVVFKKKSLMQIGGFPEEYPYVFDYVFFIDFSERYNVCLYDKYLSIYRMVESASNRTDVQLDFYRGDMYLLDRTKEKSLFVRKYEKEIIKFSIKNKSIEVQKLIHDFPCEASNINYIFFRCVRMLNLMRNNVYRRKIMPDKLDQLL